MTQHCPVDCGSRSRLSPGSLVPGAAEVHFGLTVVVLIVLVGLPSVFSTVGDKRQVVVATPGPARLLIEAVLYAAAATVPWFIWPVWYSVASLVIVAGAVLAGVPRSVWLLTGAQRAPSSQSETEAS